MCAEQSSSYTRDGRIKSFSKIPLPSFRHGKRSIKAVWNAGLSRRHRDLAIYLVMLHPQIFSGKGDAPSLCILIN